MSLRYLLLSLLLGLSQPSFAFNLCRSPWTEFSNEPGRFGAFPETHVSYFRFSFQVPSDKKVNLRIRGQIPKGRYATFNLYDQETRSSLGSIPDSLFPMDTPQLQNQASPGAPFTLWITPDKALNHSYELWYRIYLPQEDIQGGVNLPVIEAFDSESHLPTPCPLALESLPAPEGSLLGFSNLPPKPTEDGEIFFYASRGLGFYNNADNQYLVARLNFSQKKSFALFRFKSPSFGLEKPGQPRPEVRYFSFCMGSAKTTRTSGCISDEEFILGETETFLLVGPETESGVNIRELCKAHGINFLPKGKNFIPLIIYRNVLAREDFPGRVNTDFLWPPTNEQINKAEASRLFAQHNFLGSYSPVGKQLDLIESLDWIKSKH
ncbi:MAG: hypothetical protein EBQ92_04650 [Proteobacteria bacterium]|nr:hypothetical protein [Pseudomonadota bacterium]